MTVDLESYFARIGWTGARDTTRATLASLLEAHVRRIPFENLDVLLGDKPRLDLPTLAAKLVGARRGGYCYEHATLFAAVLEQLGFAVQRHSARVIGTMPKHSAPRTHMFLTTVIDSERVVVDPGFGGLTPRVPVPLDGAQVRFGSDEHWIARDADGEYALIARTPQGERTAWVSSLATDVPIDFELANHYTATHPASPFTQRLFLRAFTDDGRVTVVNRDVTVYRGDQPMERYALANRAALRELMVRAFGFDLPALLGVRVPMIPEWT